jgi:TetR/AcrR family transcriptional regulator, transcriptional repressor for nem operon
MRISREEVARNRERIVEAAAQLFRERGFDGIGVAELMREAGFTHGGFYGHFSSKDELIAEASRRALTRSLALLTETAENASRNPLSVLASSYLSPQHRDDPGGGCLLAALGSDVSRQSRAVRRTATNHVRGAVELFAKLVPGKSRAARRQKAIRIYATLVGAMVIARAVDDRELSQEILAAGRAPAKG